MNIREIENLTFEDVEKFKEDGIAEKITVKEHDCYFINLEGCFGYSVLVFKNNRHIYHVNNYQLHYPSRKTEELKDYYIEILNNKLFTELELLEDIKDYNEYKNKSHYVRNYWIMQFERVSAFYIGELEPEQVEAKKSMVYCPPCFSYVRDKEIVENAYKFINHIEKSYQRVMENIEVFEKMISYELSNHEACITRDYTETLEGLGLEFKELTEEQQGIVKSELKRQIETYIY